MKGDKSNSTGRVSVCFKSVCVIYFVKLKRICRSVGLSRVCVSVERNWCLPHQAAVGCFGLSLSPSSSVGVRITKRQRANATRSTR